jgi:EmrB/QacA subfamily drug resistance transporter
VLWWRRWRRQLRDSPRYTQVVLGVALFGLFTTNFNVSVLAVVIPRLVDDFDTTKSVISWVVTGPLLAFAVLGPTAGKLGDLYGRRKVYLVGLGGVAIFAGLTAVATSPLQLIVFRTVAATFGSSTGPSGMAIIAEQFPRDRRVQALGYWGLVLAGGPVLGMVIGGPIADAFGWRWLFIPQIPLAVLGLVLSALVLPETRADKRVRFDVAGSVLLAVSVGSLLLAVNRGPIWGWGEPRIVGMFLLSPLAAYAFVRAERRVANPMIPLEYFRRRNFAAPMVGQFLVNFAYQGGFVLVPLMLAEVYGYTSTRISLVTMARPLFYGLAGPFAGSMAVRFGERRAAVTGAVLVVASCVMLAMIHASRVDLMIFGALTLAGAGLGGMVPAMTATVTMAVEDADLGIAGATSQMMLQVGTVLGMQVQQTIQVAREPSGLESSYDTAFLVGAAVAVVGVVVASLVRSTPRPAPVRARRSSAPAGTGTPLAAAPADGAGTPLAAAPADG